MIDIHCHVLPHLDDGAADWDAALAMARMAQADGVRQIVATPHWTGAPGETESTLAQADELRRRLQAEGLRLKIHVGNEVVLVPNLVEALKEQRALTLAGSSYVLLETAQLDRGAYIHNALFQLQSHGYRIILAHPERVRGWHTDLEDLVQLIERGCYLQVNAASVLGEFGRPVQKAAERLLRRGWVSILASDGHSPEGRPPVLRRAFLRCAELVGEEAATELVEANPARVLCDEQLPYLEIERQERRFFLFPWRR